MLAWTRRVERLAASAILMICMAWPALSHDAAIRVIDGDTLVINDQRVRLYGIDAPELHQTCEDRPCGIQARDTLQALIAHHDLSCKPTAQDRYGRWVAICTADGVDLSQAMAQAGMAVAYLRYSAKYESDERVARQQHVGIWATQFVMPWDWRAGRR